MARVIAAEETTAATTPPTGQPPQGVRAVPHEVLQALDFAETRLEIEIAISAALPWAARDGVDETSLLLTKVSLLALDDALAGARRKLELCALGPGERRSRSESLLPTAERSRLPTPSGACLGAAPASLPQQEPPSGVGRVVMNHSTHVDGLLPVLRRLEKDQFVKTAIPGALRNGNSKVARPVQRVRAEGWLEGWQRLAPGVRPAPPLAPSQSSLRASMALALSAWRLRRPLGTCNGRYCLLPISTYALLRWRASSFAYSATTTQVDAVGAAGVAGVAGAAWTHAASCSPSSAMRPTMRWWTT